MSAVTDLISNATSSGYTAPTQYNTWQPSNVSGQDSNFNTAVNNNFTSSGATAPAWQQYLASVTNNPYQTGAQTAANAGGAAYTNLGNQALTTASNLNGAANGVLQTSMDPMSSLYDTSRQNNTDTTNASLAARGLATSGYGADLAAQSDQSFNQNWQNNLLSRQTQGLGAASTASGEAANLGAGGAGSLVAGGATPLSTYNSGLSTTAGGLNTFDQGSTATDNQALSAIMSYLNLGADQANRQGIFDNQYWTNQNAYTTNSNNQNAAMWGDIGNLGQNAGMSFAPLLFAGA